MQFDSALYLWFLALAFVVSWLLVRRPRAQAAWLLALSYVFYGSWNYKLLGLILLSTTVDYAIGWKVHDAPDDRARKRWLLISLVTNLGVLGVFKYFDFFASSLRELLGWAGSDVRVPLLHLVLPVGISFYTFQTLSYTIDIYRRRLEPVRDPLRFALFVAFFPQLVAGPIVRASEFLPQLEHPPRFVSESQQRGLFLLLVGFFKKVVVADYLAVNLVDRVFESPGMYSSVEVLLGVYGYAVQIYGDFSGYTDIAIGSALLLGYQLPQNFDRPYGSRNLAEFWRRWHMTLSSWLRDYLYVPLGGNRHGVYKTYRNLFLTMLLGGLWHGASYTFVLWGAIHGAGLAVLRAWQRHAESRGHTPTRSWWRDALGVVATFHFVCFAWVFFRAPTLDAALEVLGAIARGTTFVPNVTAPVALLIGGTLVAQCVPKRWFERLADRWLVLPAPAQALALVTAAIAVARVKDAAVVPFIYFQF